MTAELLPGLLVAVPLMGATLPVAIGLVRQRVGWSIAALVLTVETGLASWLAYAVYADGRRVTHVLGGTSFGRKTTEVGGTSTEGFIVGIELAARRSHSRARRRTSPSASNWSATPSLGWWCC